MNKREFDFTFKENMSKEDIQAVLEQHSAFLGADKITELRDNLKESKAKAEELQVTLDKVNEEYAPFKEQAVQDKYSKLLPKNANKDLMKDILKLSGVNEEMSEEDISKAFEEVITERDYLQVKVSTSDPKVEKSESSIFGASTKQQEASQTSTIFD